MRFRTGWILSIVLIASLFCSVALAYPRWPEGIKQGECDPKLECIYPTDGSQYQKNHPNAKSIGGFYVDLTSPNSRATLNWEGGICEGPSGIEGRSKRISTSSKGRNYINFPEKGGKQPTVCSFKFWLTNVSKSDGGNIDFEMNYDMDY